MCTCSPLMQQHEVTHPTSPTTVRLFKYKMLDEASLDSQLRQSAHGLAKSQGSDADIVLQLSQLLHNHREGVCHPLTMPCHFCAQC